jgi:hypothetical protein
VTDLGNQATAVFAASLLPDPASFPYATAAFKDFGAARAALVAVLVGQLCNGEQGVHAGLLRSAKHEPLA